MMYLIKGIFLAESTAAIPKKMGSRIVQRAHIAQTQKRFFLAPPVFIVHIKLSSLSFGVNDAKKGQPDVIWMCLVLLFCLSS
mmetsp:Transcript_43638/g.48534  ORF Transcript_43638/g.48534 Transcript_43638/m.48534 type:complete len:82 (+) Transcript_43638:987-1232(+)